MQHRAAAAPTRRWGFVCALARTWQTVEGQALPDLGPQRPRTYAQRPRVPRLAGAPGGKTFWSLRHRRWLRPLGDVTVVRREKGRTVGPNPPQILVTTRDAWTPRQVGGADPRSGPVEQSHRALKTALGLGAPHVGREAGRIEQAFGMAVLAYGLRIRVCHRDLLPGKPWSVAQLQHACRWRVIPNQVEHHTKAKRGKGCKAASYMAFAE